MAYKHTLSGTVVGQRTIYVNTSSGGRESIRCPVFSASDPLSLRNENDTSLDSAFVINNIKGFNYTTFTYGLSPYFDLQAIYTALETYAPTLFPGQHALPRLASTFVSVDRPDSPYLTGNIYRISGDEQYNASLSDKMPAYGGSVYSSNFVLAAAISDDAYTAGTSWHMPNCISESAFATSTTGSTGLYLASSGPAYNMLFHLGYGTFPGYSIPWLTLPGFSEDGSLGSIRMRFSGSSDEPKIESVELLRCFPSATISVNVDGVPTSLRADTVLFGPFDTVPAGSESLNDSGYSGATSGTSSTGSRNPWQTSGNGGVQGGDGTHKPYGGNLDPDATLAQMTYWANATDSMESGVHVWRLTQTQVSDLFNVFWEDNFIDTLSKLFSGNIENCILSLYTTQFNAANRGNAGIDLYLGNYKTGVTAQQVYSISKRSGIINISLDEVDGTVADYESTSLYIYLPYVGFRQIDPSKYMGTGIQITVWMDFMRGVVSYWLYGKSASGVDSDGDWIRGNNMVMDIFTASMKNEIPIGSAQFANMISGMNSVINGGIQLGTGLGAASLGDPMALGSIVGGATSVASGAISAMTPTYQTIGGIGGGMGLVTPFRIFCLVFRNCDTTPVNKKDFVGGPSHQSVGRLSQLSGFTKCEQVVLGGGIPLDYKEDILAQLRNGVYI